MILILAFIIIYSNSFKGKKGEKKKEKRKERKKKEKRKKRKKRGPSQWSPAS